ncbi:MAG: hypothetical protein GX208_05520 [Firmicutes bacterium]|nr:hypothetical protein [Bacillota bacterium]
MKKIGIITICDYTNYGNRLQNYAVQEVLRTFGYEVETVANSPISAHEQGLREIFERSKKMKPSELMPNLLRKVANCTKKSIYLNAIYARKMAFKEWTSKYIKETNFTVTPDTVFSHDNCPGSAQGV